MLLKTIVFCNLLVISSGSYGEGQFKTKVNRVIDGDTIEIIISEHPESLQKVHIRLLGIDTPEKNPHLAECPQEMSLAKIAQQKLSKLLPVNTAITVNDIKYDKYGGRILGTVVFNDINVNQWLVNQNLAVAYFGVGPKHNWCD